jgi:hypothetical protein
MTLISKKFLRKNIVSKSQPENPQKRRRKKRYFWKKMPRPFI